MNSYERLFARMEGKPVDKIPNLNIVMGFAAKAANIPYSKFCTNPESMVEANLLCHEKFGIDVVTTMSDPYAETSAFGAEIEYPYDSNPVCKIHLLKDYSDVKVMRVHDIGECKRLSDRVKTIELYKNAVKGKCPIVGWVEGAFAELIDLRGMNESFMDIYDEPEFVREVMDICLEQAKLFARAQIEAGADIIGVGDAAASLVGEKLYESLIMPYEIRIIEEIHRMGAKAKLHICGNITPLLDIMVKTGADIIDVDWMVDFRAACEKFGKSISANGNYDPVGVILQGNPQSIASAVRDCINMGRNNYMVCGGCEVPLNTPHENLLAANSALYK